MNVGRHLGSSFRLLYLPMLSPCEQYMYLWVYNMAWLNEGVWMWYNVHYEWLHLPALTMVALKSAGNCRRDLVRKNKTKWRFLRNLHICFWFLNWGVDKCYIRIHFEVYKQLRMCHTNAVLNYSVHLSFKYIIFNIVFIYTHEYSHYDSFKVNRWLA